MPRVQAHRLFELFEQDMQQQQDRPRIQAENKEACPGGYRQWFRGALGLAESHGGILERDEKRKEFSAFDVDIADVTASFLGKRGRTPTYGDMLQLMMASHHARMAHQSARFVEAEGHVVLPSHFAHISAYTDTVFGLLDAMQLEAYEDPEFIGDQFFENKETRTNGGYLIGVYNDGQSDDDLADGEPYGTVGLKESRVHIPDNQRRGNVIQLNVKDMIFDRTGTVQEKAKKSGEAVRRKKERKQARTFMGIDNIYSRDGVSNNTYLDTAGTTPNNYVNSAVVPLVSYESIDTALQTMLFNTDPFTGFEIPFPGPYEVAVFPQHWYRLESIARQTELETRVLTGSTSSGAGATTVIRRFSQVPYDIQPMRLSPFWFNLLNASVGSGATTIERWFLGKFKRCFQYRTLIPYQSAEAPLSSEDVRRDIVFINVSFEHGTPAVIEPRYSGMFTADDITP